MSSLPSPLARFVQPEYTGENRCVPCTVVNEGIAAGLAVVAAALVWPTAGALGGVVAAGAVFLAGSAVVYLRGYLVPGTPSLTKRYLPDRVLARFDQAPPVVADDAPTAGDLPGDDAGLGAVDAGVELVDPEQLLRNADAIEPCASHDLCLTESFQAAHLAVAEPLAAGDGREAALAGLFEPSGAVRVATEDDRPVAYDGDERLNGWPSAAALVADLAAHLTLADRSEGWADVAPVQRLGILRALRGFLSTCPVCGGRVGMTDDTVESCCRSWDVVAVRCRDCAAHFVELNPGQFEDQLAAERPGPTEGGFTW